MLTDKQLDFVPCEGLRSLGDVARHIANTEEGWFRFVITWQYDEWPNEYGAADYPTVASIKALLTEVHSRTETHLDTLSLDDLGQQIQTPGGEQLSSYWIIWHVIDHELRHRGEIYLMLGLMGLEVPEI